MRPVLLVAVLSCSLGAVVAQGKKQPIEMLPIGSLEQFDDWSARDERMGSPVLAERRFTDIVVRLAGSDPKSGPPTVQVAKTGRGAKMVIARGTEQQLDIVARVCKQMQRPAVVNTRLQCSFVTMPVAVAGAYGMKPGEVAAVDEAGASQLVRAALKGGGSLHNLPEVVTGPLAPFVRDTGAVGGGANRAAALSLRGEMVPMLDGEVAVGVHVVRGELPRDPTRVPDPALMQPVFRLAANRAATFMIVERDIAIVLLVRCTDVTAVDAPRAGEAERPAAPAPKAAVRDRC